MSSNSFTGNIFDFQIFPLTEARIEQIGSYFDEVAQQFIGSSRNANGTLFTSGNQISNDGATIVASGETNELINNPSGTVTDGWIVIFDDVYGYRAIDLQYLRDFDYSRGEAADAYLDDELFALEVDIIVSPTGNFNEFGDAFGFI